MKERTATTIGQVLELSIRLYYAQMVRAAWSIQKKIRNGERILDSAQVDRTECASNMISSCLLVALRARSVYLSDKGNFGDPQVRWCHQALSYCSFSNGW